MITVLLLHLRLHRTITNQEPMFSQEQIIPAQILQTGPAIHTEDTVAMEDTVVTEVGEAMVAGVTEV